MPPQTVTSRTAALVAAVLLIAACNGDDAPDDADAVTGGEEVSVRAVGAEPFEDAPASVPVGEVALRLVNDDELGHSLRIEELDDGVDLVPGGEEGTATVTFEGGETYTYYCDVPGHRSLGMEGEFEAG